MEKYNSCEKKDYHHNHKCCEKKCCYTDHKCCEKKDCHTHHKCCDKKPHDHKKKNKADFTDFEYYTLDPNVDVPNRFELPEDIQTPVASITFDQLKKGNLVWLSGVLGLDNDHFNSDRRVFVRIFKGNPPVFIPGSEIYRARIEIHEAGNGDQVVVPLAHVDAIQNDDRNVTYTVTLEPSGDDVFLQGPVTFTGALIKK